MNKRHTYARFGSTDHHVLACPTNKQGMKKIGFYLEDEDATHIDHEDNLNVSSFFQVFSTIHLNVFY